MENKAKEAFELGCQDVIKKREEIKRVKKNIITGQNATLAAELDFEWLNNGN